MLIKRIKFLGLFILLVSLAITMAACDMGNGVVNEISNEPLKITSVEEISNKTVGYGTVFEDLGLPEEVEVRLDDNSSVNLTVNWLKGDYDSKIAETYSIVGELELTEGIINLDNLKSSVEVTVQEEDITLYTVTVNYDDNKGTVTGAGAYQEGEEVELTATAKEEYEFVEWTGYVESTENTTTFNMPSENVELTALFVEIIKVEFEDSNLEEVVREKIDKPDGDLYLSDVINIIELDARSRGIESIEGIQYLTKLGELQIQENEISDINPLAGLTNLNWLVFHNNKVSDISILADLTNLERLNFNWNKVSDISILGNLTNLEELSFGNNEVSDISVLVNLTTLKTLYFSHNEVSDISVLENLTNLERLLFSNNQILDISVLENLTKLVRLYFGNNGVSNISILENLTNLEFLLFSNNGVLDISVLENLTNLQWLYFYGNEVSDIRVLENLTNLVRLYFGGNEVSDIKVLENLTNLEQLSFQKNQISNISSLVENDGLGKGDEINMSYNYLDLNPGSKDMDNINNLIDRGVVVEYKPQN